MRDNKIFKKQPALVGYYSAQPGSRLMTLHKKKKKDMHNKIWIGVAMWKLKFQSWQSAKHMCFYKVYQL